MMPHQFNRDTHNQPPLTTSQLQPNTQTQTQNTGMFGSPSVNWNSLSLGGSAGPGGHGPSESRTQYQAGYLMSSQQNQHSPHGHSPPSHSEDPPLLSTKSLSPSHGHTSPHSHQRTFGYASEFGTDSLFHRSTTRATLSDEDAPPTTSVLDIPSSLPTSSGARTPVFSTPQRPTQNTSTRPEKPHFLTVYGFPPSLYSSISNSFAALAEVSAQPERGDSGANWFVVGYRTEDGARRALSRDGEVVSAEGGRWMIGVRWRDSLSASSGSPGKDQDPNQSLTAATTSTALVRSFLPGLNVSESPLAPASSAYKKQEAAKPKPAPAMNAPASDSNGGAGGGWVRSIGDLIFGW